MSNELKAFSEQMIPALEEEMRAVFRANGSTPDLFYGMMHYHMGWVDARLKPTSNYGGKRIRPLLCMLTCQAAGGHWEQAVPAAASVEILHNFSLVHDDIEDASPTRRGRLTVWKIWGKAQAINCGDAMFAISHLALNRLTERDVAASIVVEALRRFDETCVQLTQGQFADMDFENRHTVQVEEYLAMIQGKTAVLLSLCTELGALIAGCSPKTINHYAAFGRNLGLAFQVIDDILGIWGDENKTGKSAATDIITRKKTLPVLYGLNKSQALRDLYRQPETDEAFVREAVQILDQEGAREFAIERANYYSQSALGHLEEAQAAGPAAPALYQLADMLLNRDF